MVRNSTFVESEGKNCAVVNILGFFFIIDKRDHQTPRAVTDVDKKFIKSKIDWLM